jgi:glyoxylase-like metal-dependent hydrolase (beta-lactamase superfamily II)
MAKKREQQQPCDADSIAKCQPYVLTLAHYHLDHSGEAATFTALFPDFETFGHLPDLYIVSDSAHRLRFRELATELRAQDSNAVQWLEQLHALTGDKSAPHGEKSEVDGTPPKRQRRR